MSWIGKTWNSLKCEHFENFIMTLDSKYGARNTKRFIKPHEAAANITFRVEDP